jgi:nitrite reductase/ring-hydroxylating ferredoxin subunit
MKSTSTASHIRVGTLAELREQGCIVVRGSDRSIAVFEDEGKVRAVDNRCPHLGFPLSRGSIQNGMITCHWHHARFDAASGCTFDLFADDVPAYDTHVVHGEVFVEPHPRHRNTAESARRRLAEGLQMSIGLISAKSILALRSLGRPDTEIVREIARFGLRNRDDWASGMTILSAMAQIVPQFSDEVGYAALYQAARHVAGDCAGASPRRDRLALDTDDVPRDQLDRWLQHWTKVRHRDGAERTLRTAIANGVPKDELIEMIAAAATQRYYAAGGHLLDFCNKAFELLDVIGWEHAPDAVASLVSQLVSSRGGEESDEWYHPINLVELVRAAAPKLTDAVLHHSDADIDVQALADALLVDDPRAVIDAMLDAANAGANLETLARALAYAAAMRVARFGTANEMGDWIAALHSFTHCNALHQIITRCPSPRLAPALLHGAMSVYLNRFLNVPPAALPGERKPIDDELTDADDLLGAFAAQLDSQQQVGRAATLVARYLQLGHPVAAFIDALAWAVLREDANFHTFQMLEAGVRQYHQWGDCPAGHRVLIAMARYIAAHSPTQRAQWQTARIALRLHRGEDIYEEEA